MTFERIKTKLAAVRRARAERARYTGRNREPFYRLAEKYLPEERDALVVDIGAGDGSFARTLGLAGIYPNLWLLDGNESAVAGLKKEFSNAAHWRAPDRLPFGGGEARFIHCSHMVEHLAPNELYGFLKEVDRVLADGGALVISAPLLWSGFYGDLSHAKPYNPEVFIKYLCSASSNPSADAVSKGYKPLDLVYRYRDLGDDDGVFLASANPLLDTAVSLGRAAARKLGFRKYKKNGYTLVLKKNGS
ncbi:MAG: class I SAM-dependent methyltransferase [Candidatus Nitrospinota bacterium M3_3B_026]